MSLAVHSSTGCCAFARRSAEDLAPFRALEETVRETALELSSKSPDRTVR